MPIRPDDEKSLIKQLLPMTDETIVLPEEVTTTYALLETTKGYISPLSLLLRLYKTEYNSLLLTLIEKGAKVYNDLFPFIFAIADKIPDEGLKKLIDNHDAELTTPLLHENSTTLDGDLEKNIFYIAANQRYVSVLLLDYFIKTKKLDPTVRYVNSNTGTVSPSGVELAISSENLPLLAYYQTQTVCPNLIDTIPEELLLALKTYQKEIPETETNENQFSESVKAFKQTHDIKSLRKWLASSKGREFTLLEALFFTRKEVAAFLLREIVILDNNVPCYPKYESSIYAGLIAQKYMPTPIPFRSDTSALSKEESDACNRELVIKSDGTGEPTQCFIKKRMLTVEKRNQKTSCTGRYKNAFDTDDCFSARELIKPT